MPAGTNLGSLGEAFIDIRASLDKLNKDLGKVDSAVNKKLKGMGTSMTNVGKQMSLKLTAPIAAFGAMTVRTAGNFEASMNKVKAVSGATGDQFTALRDKAKDLGATTQFSASQAGDAMNFLAMAGFDADKILGSMDSTLQLAAASALDLGTAADITSNILTGFGKDVSELAHVNDVLVKTTTSTNTNMIQLGEAMKFVAPVAASAGVSIEETSAAIGLLGNAGIQASMAGTTLRGALARMLDPSKEVSDAMEQIGLKVTDANGKLLPMADILRQLEDHAEDTGLMMKLFGLRAGPGMAALVGQGADALEKLTDELINSGGHAQEIAEVQMKGFNGAMKELKSAFEALQIAIGESGLLEFMTGLVKGLAEWIREMAKANPEILKWGVVIAGVVAVAGPLLIVLGQVAIAMSALGPAAAAAGSAFAGLSLLTHVRNFRDLGAAISLAVESSILLKAALIALPIAATAKGLHDVYQETKKLGEAESLKDMNDRLEEAHQLWDDQQGVIGNIVDILTGPMRGALMVIPNLIESITLAWKAWQEGGFTGPGGIIDSLYGVGQAGKAAVDELERLGQIHVDKHLQDMRVELAKAKEEGNLTAAEIRQLEHDIRALEEASTKQRDVNKELKESWKELNDSLKERGFNEKEYLKLLDEHLDKVEDLKHKGLTEELEKENQRWKEVQESVLNELEAKREEKKVTDENTGSQKALNDELDRLKANFEAALNPGQALNDKLNQLKGLGYSAQQAAAVLGDEILEVIEKQKELDAATGKTGRTYSEFTQEVIDSSERLKDNKQLLADTLKAHNDLIKKEIELSDHMRREGKKIQDAFEKDMAPKIKWPKEVRDKIDEILHGSKAIARQWKEDLAAAAKKAEREIGAVAIVVKEAADEGKSAEEITKMYGAQIRAAGESAERFGLQLDPTVEALYRQEKAMDANAEMVQQWEAVWAESLGNILSGFVTWAADMIAQGNTFASKLLSIFLNRLFQPLFMAIDKFAGNFAQALGGLFAGKGFNFGSLFSGITDIFTGGKGSLVKTLAGVGTTAATTATAAGVGVGAGVGAGTAVGAGVGMGLPVGAGVGAEVAAGTTTVAGGSSLFTSLGAFMTNPITIGVAGAILGGVGLYKLFSKSTWEKASKEVSRDFAGLKVGDDLIRTFIEGVGLTKKTAEHVRKDLLSSPLFFQQALLPAAQQAGKVDELIASFGQLEVMGQKFDLSAAAAEAVAGNFDKLNTEFIKIFSQSQELQRVMPNWRDTLTVGTVAQDALNDEATKAREETQKYREALNKMEEVMEDGEAGALELIKAFQDLGEGSDALAALMDALKEAGGDLEKAMEILAGKLKSAEAAEAAAAGPGAAGGTKAAGGGVTIKRGGGATQVVDPNKKISLFSGFYAEAMRQYKKTGKWPTFGDFIKQGKITPAHTGGMVTSSGIFNLRQGELVMPESMVQQMGMGFRAIEQMRDRMAMVERWLRPSVMPGQEGREHPFGDREPGTVVNTRFDIRSRSEDLKATFLDEVMPLWYRELESGRGGYREGMTRLVNETGDM